jgi:hypothetical protein
VIRANAVKEDNTYITIGVEWNKEKKKNLRPLKLDMLNWTCCFKFLDHHSAQYLELNAVLISTDYTLKSEAASTNLKVLLLLEIVLFLGCN